MACRTVSVLFSALASFPSFFFSCRTIFALPILLLLRCCHASLHVSPHLFLDADRGNALSDAPRRARSLKTYIDGLWRQLWEAAGLHVVGLALVPGIASPSKLHCSDAWAVAMLVFMATGCFLVGFVMLMLRLMQRYAELEEVEDQLRRPLVERGDGVGRGGRRRRTVYATLAVVFFVLFTVAIARFSWLLACPGR